MVVIFPNVVQSLGFKNSFCPFKSLTVLEINFVYELLNDFYDRQDLF